MHADTESLSSGPQKPPAAVRPPKQWKWVSLRMLVHVLVIVFAFVLIVMSLLPLEQLDKDSTGENYTEYIEAVAAMSAAPFLCLFVSIAEIITRIVRPGNAGIHPFVFMGLTVVCAIAAFVTATMNALWVAEYISEKDNEDANWWRDTCKDISFWSMSDDEWCEDGFYDNEGYYIAVTVLGFVLFTCEAVLCCFMTGRDVWARRKQRRAMKVVRQPA